MSNLKQLYQVDTEANSLLQVNFSPHRSKESKKNHQLNKIRERYRQEYLKYHAQQKQRTTEKLMLLDYVIKSAGEFNELLQKNEQ